MSPLFKKTASIALTLLCSIMPASAIYNLEIDDVNAMSSFQLESGGNDNDGYTYTVVNSDASVPAFINFKATTAKLDAGDRMITFEYRASAPGNPRVLGSMVNLNFVRSAGSATNILYHLNTYTTSAGDDQWYRVTFDIGAERDKPLGFGKLKGHTLWVHFVGIPVGSSITIRNAKVAPYEFAQTVTDISADSKTTIHPETYNVGVYNGYGHHARQFVNEARIPYTNPAVQGRFPILGWNGVEPHVDNGSIDWDRLESDFKDYWECGFSLAMPTGNPQANAHCIWDNIGRFVFNGTGLKMFLKPNDLTDDEIKYYAGADRLAGWFIRDEPFVFNLHEMRGIVDRVTSFDTQHILYGNIFGCQGDDMSATGARDYEDYVNQYLTQVGIGYLSYDFYPVRQYEESGQRFMHPLFFYNLEFASRISRQHGIPFWGFVHSVESNCGVEGQKYPKPSIEEMKIEAFCALAYGAQAIQYFTYGCPYDPEYNYQNSPLDSDGNRTPTWDMVKTVNTEINALCDVFLGAQVRWVANTAENTPQGCRSLTADMLPDGFNAITTDCPTGLCVSRLSNGNCEYLMVINPDLDATQTVRFDKSVECRQVTPQGIVQPTGDTFTLAPGDYVIYLLGDATPTASDTTAPWINPDRRLTDSRHQANEIDLRQSATGVSYINNMGTENFRNYTLTPATATGLTVTPRQAADNWGAWFNYTVNVEQDGYYNLRIRHAVPWDTYRRVASSSAPLNADGSLCADYRLDYDSSVNWPSAFPASMILEIDGESIMPANQPCYPACPSADDIDGTAYNAMLANPSSWVDNESASLPAELQAALRFWPEGGNNTPTPRVNDKADYRNVLLTAGQHTITVRSLCSPWQFYGIEIEPTSLSGIEDIITDDVAGTKAQWFDPSGRHVSPDNAAPGLYIIKQGSTVRKVIKK